MQPIRELLRYTRGLNTYFLVIAITSVIGALVNFAVPYITKLATDWVVAINNGTAEFEWSGIWLLMGGLIATTIVTTLATDIGGWHGDMMSVRARQQLSRRYYQHLLSLPQSYYDGEVTGTIINRLSRAITDVTQFLQFFANNLLQMLLTMGITIAVLLWYSWPLAVLLLLLVPTNLYLTARTSKRWQQYESQKNKHFDIASGRFAEAVGQMRLIKSFASEGRELDSFSGRLKRMIGITVKQSRWWHGMNAIRGIAFGLIFAGLYAVLFYETARGAFTVGDLVLLIALITQVSFPLRNLSYFVDTYQRAVANSRDYLAAMGEKPELDDTGDELVITRGEISYRDVSFAYESKKQVLSGVDFNILPDQKVALVGESGGGKTTIANLLMRLYEPDSGRITIDETDIARVSRASLRSQIATVFQDAALFSGSIRDNIAYAQPDASDEQVVAAARAANAHDFISKFPDGYESKIGERGIKLSGGQKQRIAIARALLKDAPILILDEATSALDSRAEAEVQEALNRLMKGRTTLIIAHRLSTIAGVDMIVTISDGKVDEVGSPQKLAKTDGIYAQLLKLQMGATEKAKKQLAKYDITT